MLKTLEMNSSMVKRLVYWIQNNLLHLYICSDCRHHAISCVRSVIPGSDKTCAFAVKWMARGRVTNRDITDNWTKLQLINGQNESKNEELIALPHGKLIMRKDTAFLYHIEMFICRPFHRKRERKEKSGVFVFIIKWVVFYRSFSYQQFSLGIRWIVLRIWSAREYERFIKIH